MIIKDLVQGSQEWLDFRQSHLGASDAATIMNLNPYNSRLDLWEEKVFGKKKPINAAMRRGSELELQARQHYELETGRVMYPIVAEDDIANFLSASFDGLTPEFDYGVEIKCGKKSYLQAKEGIIPPYYYAQMQHQMMIADIDQIDYYCWNGSEGLLFEIKRDTSFISDMFDAEMKFWYHVINIIQPID